MFKGLFGEKFQENWRGTADKAGLADKLGVIGVGLSQLSAGQAPNILPAWQAVEDRRAKRKLGEAMANPELLAGFSPEQQKMLSLMPPDMAQSLIMEKVFAPPPEPVKPNYDYIEGVGMVDMNNPPADMMAGNFAPASPMPMTAEEKAMWGLGEGTYIVDPKTKRPVLIEGTGAPDIGDRYRVVGGSLVDLQAEGGPKSVMDGAMQEEVVMGPDGKPIIIKGPAGTSAKFTEAQSKDNVYATRAEGAIAALEPVANALTERSGVVGEALGGVTLGLSREALQSDDYQLAKQAGREFLATILRKDTGAAVTPSEEAMYGQMFLPQPGDGAAVLEQKKTARARAVEAIKAGMNPDQILAIGRALSATEERTGSTASPAPAADADGWTTLPNGVKVRVKQ